MKFLPKQPAILMLEDGTVYRGNAAGIIGTTTGELCFNTGMTGYQEVFTDPSYFGQMIVMTNVHIGNYGVKNEEVESDTVKISGMICSTYTNAYSRHQAHSSLQDYFTQHKIVAISEVDTRALVQHIRKNGSMNAIISSEILDLQQLRSSLMQVPSMQNLELASHVSTTAAYEWGNPNASKRVSVIDYGIKRNILNSIANEDVFLKIFPHNATLADLNTFSPDGYFISNGPGDPAAMPNAIELVKNMINSNFPTFGICLGHQLMALALEIPTFKMKQGHRGLNHPVKNLRKNLCEITTQNHGFAVDPLQAKSSDQIEVSHINLNDDTIEGFYVKNKPAFSVQYHPESTPGPHDSKYLFADYRAML